MSSLDSLNLDGVILNPRCFLLSSYHTGGVRLGQHASPPSPLRERDMKHRVTSRLNKLSSFSDQQCRSEELQPARGRSRWLALRPWSPSSCPVSLWSACVDGPTSTEHPGDGGLITTLNLMNYRNGLISKKTETLADACTLKKEKRLIP